MTMKFKPLGRSGVQVSGLCFGTMSFGGDADEAESGAMFRACREAGINFFDCADQYSEGRAEEILGRLMRGERENLVITTKCFNPSGDDINARGTSRRHVTRAVEASLRRLQTDRVDVLFLHQFDPRTPLEESVRALEDMVRAGKVLYPALSNWAAWQVQKAFDLQAQRDWAPVQLIQPMYNLLKRQAEVELLPMAAHNGIGVIPYSPSAAGLLSGKYSGEASGRIRTNARYAARYGEPWVVGTAQRFVDFCKARGLNPVATAVAWVGAHPAVTAPIIGARNLAQLGDSLAAVSVDMSPGMRAEIAALSPAPPPATDRLEEVRPQSE
jgi:aryl-alcohol dehydrogenase-like predicted oxidoreductase